MAVSLIEGGVVGAVVSELLKVVIDVTKKTVKFKSKLKRLEATLKDISPIFEEIEQLNKLLKLKQKDTDMFVDRLKEGTELVLKCSKIECWNVVKRYKYANKLIDLDNSLLRFFQMDVQLQLVCDSKKSLVGLSSTSDKLDRVLSILGKGGSCGVPGLPDGVVGLDEPLLELKAMLISGNGPVVLSAPGGCGKTTLAKMLCRDKEIQEIFGDNIFFVTVSKTANLKGIVQKLFQHKGRQPPEFDSDEDAINQMEQLIYQLIPATDFILLVLDDVWLEWESLIEDFMFGIRGYKVLVTSRFVFPRFDSTYKLNILNDQDAMTLFRHSALPRGGNPNIPDNLVNKIVKGCKGFPLALTVIGRSLYGRPEVSWKNLLKKWSEGQSILDSNKDKLLLRLQTSLDALDQMAIVKESFLDLGSFPEDQKIPATALMDMWVELYGLDEDGMETLDNLLELSFRNLVNLVPSRKEVIEVEGYCNEHFVMQHDLLRELAIHHSSQEPIEQRKRLVMEISGNDLPKWWVEQRQQPVNARLFSISTDETFASSWYDMQLPELEVLILNFQTRNYTLPNFMKRMDQLKVLIVTNYGFCLAELNNFPIVSYLSSLRRIRLEHVLISSLSTSMLQMRNLQKISLVMCEIGKAFEKCTVEIPNMLPNLAEIEIDYCEDLVDFPAGFCNIVSLKKLSMSYCNDLGSLPQGIGRLTNLELLRLHSCTNIEELPESIGNLQKLSFLDISDCVSMSIMPESIGELCGLRTLNMRGCPGLQELPSSVKDLRELEHVICDEETAYQWELFESHPTNLKIHVVKQDINLNWLHKVHRDRRSITERRSDLRLYLHNKNFSSFDSSIGCYSISVSLFFRIIVWA